MAKLNKIKSIFLAELNKLGNEHTDLRINKMSRSRWLRHKKRLLQPLYGIQFLGIKIADSASVMKHRPLTIEEKRKKDQKGYREKE